MTRRYRPAPAKRGRSRRPGGPSKGSYEKPRLDPHLKPVFRKIGVPKPAPFKPDPFQQQALEKIKVYDVVVSAPTGAGKNFSEHYFTPTSMGAFRGVLGGLLGGFSPLAFAEGAAAGSGGTVLNKAIMSRALAKRMREGKDLNSAERRLAAQIRGMRG